MYSNATRAKMKGIMIPTNLEIIKDLTMQDLMVEQEEVISHFRTDKTQVIDAISSIYSCCT